MKDARLDLRIKTEVKEELKQVAELSNRKVNDYMNLLIQYAIKKKLKL